MTHLLESRLVSEPLTGWGTELPRVRIRYLRFLLFREGPVGVAMQAYNLFVVSL